jgi:purine-binding chemotaxis protein CheW
MAGFRNEGMAANPEVQAGPLTQYLSFWLAGQEFALDILRVQEIREWAPVTPVPNCPDYVLGVMNLRGAVVPVIDLRLRLGLPHEPYTAQTVVIIIHIHGADRHRIMGVVVDAVAEVYDLPPERITPPPEVSSHGLEHYVLGLVTVEGRMITVLDFDRMLVAEEMNRPHLEGRTPKGLPTGMSEGSERRGLCEWGVGPNRGGVA